ncbi:hypothetical protein QOZ80_7AG0556290 [Eleusine coracana subsp. coracana]|nr:hypothetical protein QOZ80_7AG0556290 [Eleusine coracana subsp. coracana]
MCQGDVTTSSLDPLAPCAGCKHLRRRCVPGCILAPYFSSPDDGAWFAAVHGVFSASNVSKLLAELAPEDRAEAMESQVFEAVERQPNPTFGCVAYVSLLQNIVGHVRGEVAAAREELTGLVGPEEAFRPFDPADMTEEVRQAAEVKLAAALRFAREMDDRIREKMQAEAEHDDGDGGAAPEPADGVEDGGEELASSAEIETELDVMTRASVEMAWEQEYMMTIQQAAAAAGITLDQYIVMMMMQQQQHQDVVTEQQCHGQEEQYAAMGLYVTPGLGRPDLQQMSAAADATRKQELMMMQQHQQAVSGVAVMPFLPGGPANADVLLCSAATAADGARPCPRCNRTGLP